MNRASCLLLALALFVLLGSLTGGCGSDRQTETDWTVSKERLTLKRTLHVSDNANFYFGSIRDVAVDDTGRIYVADGEAHHVKILSPEGTLIDSVGTHGEGPGEFERPSQLFFAPGDSLYVLDGYYGRLSVFTPRREFVDRVSLRVGRAHPHQVFPASSGFITVFSTLGRPSDEGRDRLAVRSVSAGGSPGDTLFTTRPSQAAWRELDGGGWKYFSLPLLRSSHFAKGPADLVHYAWGDSLGVRAYDAEGELRRTVDVPFDPVPVTDEDRSRILEGYSGADRAAVEKKIPETKPAFDHFLVDDQGRYWFGRPTSVPDSTAWWVVRPDEEQVLAETLPSEVEILTVKEGQAYGKTTTEAGAPAVVRYRIETK